MTEANQPGVTTAVGTPPMPFGFTLERVYRILRDHLKVFLGIAAPPAATMILLYGVMFGVMFANLRPLLSTSGTPVAAVNAQFAMMRVMFPAMLLAMIPIMAVTAFYLAAAFHAANKIDSGSATSVRECYAEGWHRLGRSLLLLIWIYFRAFGPVLVLEVVLFGVSGWFGLSGSFGLNGSLQNPPVAAFAILPLVWLLFVGAAVYGVIVALRMSLAFPASIEEGLTAGEAIRRSSKLSKGSRGRIFLLLLVLELIGCACIFILEIVAGIVFAIGTLVIYLVPNHSTNLWTIVGILAGVVAGIALLILFYVWTALLYGSLVTALSVVYHDQRRRESASVAANLPITGTELPPGIEPA
jgi:hypothetical protein